jgi:hypothetical protein
MPPPVDFLSTSSLFLEVFFEGQKLASATGFVVRHQKSHFLVTSRHVLSGRHPDTDKPCSPTLGIPNRIEIHHHFGQGFGKWKAFSEDLYDSVGNATWLSHKRRVIDVAALPLSEIPAGVKLWTLGLERADVDMILRPGMPVSIIGFPLGLKNLASLPIWKTGHIASDPNTNYDRKPCFLIDATTRSGMSGAPVMARLSGGYESSAGVVEYSARPVTKFVGIYSGRLHELAELGITWKPHVIEEIISNGMHPKQH